MEPEDKSKIDMKAAVAQTHIQKLEARLEAQRQEIEAESRIVKPIIEQTAAWLREAEIPRDTKVLLARAALGVFGLWLYQGGSGTRKRRRSNS